MIPVEQPITTAVDSPYRNRLYPWCIIRSLPGMQRTVVSRFRSRSEAEESLKVLQRLSYVDRYQIIFDLPESLTNSTHLHRNLV